MIDQILIPRYKGTHKVTKTNDGMAIQQDNQIHSLNSTASEIYELCNGDRKVEDVFLEMKSRYPGEDIDHIVEGFLLQMLESGLIQLSEK